MALGRPKVNVEDRFWKYVEPEPNTGCWLWSGTRTDGYGQLWFNGRHHGAHRISYRLHGGDIPKGMTLDHLCRKTACVNPSHLEVVSYKVNNDRRVVKLKTHCPRGHEYNEKNTYRGRNGNRHCRVCHAYRERERYRAGRKIA